MEFGRRGKGNRSKEYNWERMEACVNDESKFAGKYYSKIGGLGHPGGNGGIGGKAGDPGNFGQITIIYSKSKWLKRISEPTNNRGSCGQPGLGGSGGIGGLNGNYYSCKYYTFGWKHCGSFSDNFRSGKNGTNGEFVELCTNKTKFVGSNFEPWRFLTMFRIDYFQGPSDKLENLLGYYNFEGEIHKITPLISLAIEFESIEEKIYEMENNMSPEERWYSTEYYRVSLERLEEYVETRVPTKQITIQDKIALKMIFSAVIGKLATLKIRENQLAVIKVQKYFDTLVSQMNSLESKQREKKIAQETRTYKHLLNEKVNEANDFIKTTVNPAIESAHRELKRSNDKLFKEINDYLKLAKDDVKQKNKLKKQLESATKINLVLGVFSFTSSICSMLGPVGQTAAAAINLGTGVAKTIVGSTAITDKDYENTKLPTGFQNSLNEANYQYYKNRIAYLEEQTTRASEAADNVTGSILHGVKTIAEKTRLDLDSLKNKIDGKHGELDMKDIGKIFELEKSVKLMAEIAEKVSETLFDLGEKLEEANEINENDTNKLETLSSKKQAKAEIGRKNLQIVKGLANGMKILQTGGNLMKTIVSGEKDIEKMADAVRNAERNVKLIEQKKTQFYEEVMEKMEKMHSQLSTLTSKLPGQSQVTLTVKKWEIKEMLKSMRGFISGFTQTMKVTEAFKRGFDTLDRALTLLIKLYDQIEQYEEKKQLAEFIANINSGSDLSQIHDPELKEVLTRLDFYISANLFFADYQKGIHAFKQWAFPFAHRYLTQIKTEKLSRDVPTMISGYTKQVESLSLALKKYAATTVDGDQYLMVQYFTSQGVSSEPFYKWRNEKWKGAIKKLLAGESIRLKADVDMSGQDSASYFKTKSAIKFKTIVLVLKTRNETRQTELDKTLDHFQMTMTHSGISLYKVVGQHFVMYDRNITYRYSFEKTKDNNHVTVNQVKYKVDGPGADFLLSPYTWWTFQINDEKDVGLGFRDLEQFENEVDLELEGSGVYLEETMVSKQDLDDLHLYNYYEVYDPETQWAFDEEANKDACIVIRADMTEAEKIEILEPKLNLTSLATSSGDTEEWNSFSIVALTSSIVVVLLFTFGIIFYLKKEYFMEYISVPVRSDDENKREEEQENNELIIFN